MGNTNHILSYKLGNIDYITIKHTANKSQYDWIEVVDVYDDPNDSDYCGVDLLLGPFSNNLKDYLMAENGYVSLDICNFDSGGTRCSSYQGKRMSGKPDRNPKTHPSHCCHRNRYIVIRIPAGNDQTAKSISISVKKTWLTRNLDVGDSDYKRAKTSASAAISKWTHIIYKVRFRYHYTTNSSNDSPYSANSDEIDVYCRYTPVNNGITKLYEDDNVFVESLGYFPWSYNPNDGSFYVPHKTSNRYPGLNSILVIYQKNTNKKLSFNISANTDNCYIRAKAHNINHWDNTVFYYLNNSTATTTVTNNSGLNYENVIEASYNDTQNNQPGIVISNIRLV